MIFDQHLMKSHNTDIVYLCPSNRIHHVKTPRSKLAGKKDLNLMTQFRCSFSTMELNVMVVFLYIYTVNHNLFFKKKARFKKGTHVEICHVACDFAASMFKYPNSISYKIFLYMFLRSVYIFYWNKFYLKKEKKGLWVFLCSFFPSGVATGNHLTHLVLLQPQHFSTIYTMSVWPLLLYPWNIWH